MNLKQTLMKFSKPLILPINRMILKQHYKANKQLSNIGEFEKILIIAPHADDETIGVGGTIKLHANNGAEVNCVVVTDGSSSSSNLSNSDLISSRRLEMKKVKGILGIQNLYFLDVIDGKVASNTRTQRLLSEIIKRTKPDVIYCTPFVDAHSDHIHTTELLADCLKAINYSCLIRLYEINCPIPPSEINCIIDITHTLHDKKRAMNVFVSQVIAFDGFLELGYIKTNLVSDINIKAVETFIEIDSQSFIKQLDKLKIKTYPYSSLFKQVNRTETLLWAIFKNYKVKRQMYAKRLYNG